MAKSVFLDGSAVIGGYTIYPTTFKINEDHKLKMIDYVSSVTLEPPDVEFEAEDMAVTRFTIEGFLETNLITSYPARGQRLAAQLNIEDFRYSGNCYIAAFSIDAIFDSAVKVTLNGTFVNEVTIAIP